jgi:hypothetical protein
MGIENQGNQRHMPPWLVRLLIATSLLVIMALGAYLLYGRELFQRPFLAVAVVIAWLGALVGITIGSEPG